MAKIWVVEDDPSIGLLIELTAKKAGHGTRLFSNAQSLEYVLSASEESLPDLLLLDLMLRRKNGFEILAEWKKDRRLAKIPVIIISALSAESDKVRGLELGAEDYITKPFGVRELQARIQAALRRVPSAAQSLTLGDLTIMTGSREIYLGRQRLDLTTKEYDLLLYLARHHGHAVTRETLLEEVWGYADAGTSSRTVDSHIKTLRLKLGDTAEEPKYIQTVRGTGYRLIAGETRC